MTVTIKGHTVACLGYEFVFSKMKIIVRGKVPYRQTHLSMLMEKTYSDSCQTVYGTWCVGKTTTNDYNCQPEYSSHYWDP